MYRIVIAVSFILLCFTLVSPSFYSAQAQNLPEYSLPEGTGETGERVPLNLNFQNNGNVGSFNIRINYDQNVVGFDPFSFFDVVTGPDFVGVPSFSLSSTVTPGQIVIILDQGFGAVPALPSGEILTINFVINSGAMAGEATNLQITIDQMTDTAGNFILPPLADTNDGLMTVVTEPPQDIVVLIEKSADTSNIDPGIPTLVEYKITIEGDGDPGSQATQVFITDPLPDEATFREDLSSDGCVMLVGPQNTVECEVGTILNDEELERLIVVSLQGTAGTDILNQAIVDYLDEIGEPRENTSNTWIIRVGGGGGGGGGGCAIADSGHIGTSGLANLAVLLIPLAFVLFKTRKRFIR